MWPETELHMSDLSQRKEQILRAVVIEYVTAAEPVSSDQIVSRYDLGVKGATVRNELSEITEMGLLEQPHTSAGRIPSDQGYRYYVDYLRSDRQMSAEDKGQVRGVQSDEETLRDLLAETTKVLSRLTHLFAAAATIKDTEVLVRHAVVTALGPDRAMLVMVLQNGHIENRILECPAGMTLEHLGQLNELLAALVQGRTLGSVAKVKTPAGMPHGVDQLAASAFGAARSAARDLTKGQLITEGEEYILAQPEFMRSREQLELLVRSLEDEDALRSAVVGRQDSGGGVTIGRENPRESMQSLSIARRLFYVGDEEAGALAIIGPTRQDYERGLSVLDYAAKAVSQTLTKIYG